MKKVIMLLALLAMTLCAFSCGGNGAGSPNSPSGENPGIPSVVQLLPSHFIAQTNGSITLHAKVLDGNGVAVPNTTVTFTNLSSPFGILSATTANTDGLGIATVTIRSTSAGFATIVAQVNNGVSNIRDKKSVFFTINDVMAVSMSLDVDSVPGDGIFDQTSDFTLFSPPPDPDDTVLVLATVRNAGGVRLAGESIFWSSDFTGDNVTFLAGTESITDTNGEARAVVQVMPESIRNTETHLNIMALAGNGAANMVTLFLQPITVASITVSANPAVVEPEGTSDISAIVMLNTGNAAPDGTTVNFSTAPKTASDPSPCGTIDPFAQTIGGVATVTFTAPSTEGTCTITARAGGVSDTTDVIVRLEIALAVLPETQTINGTTGGTTAPYTIFGGTPPYTIFTSNPLFPAVPTTVPASGGTFTVTVPPASAAATVTYTIRDSVGATTTATLTITGPGALIVTPTSQTISCSLAGGFHFTVSGGTPGYTITSLNPAVVTVAPDATGFTATPTGCGAVPPAPSSTPVSITVQDSAAPPVTATVTLTVTNP